MLVFAAQKEGEAAMLRESGEADVAVEARFVGTAIVVEVGLAEVEAVLKDRPADSHGTDVGRVKAVDGAAVCIGEALFGDAFIAELVEEAGEDGLGAFVAAGEDIALRSLQDVKRTKTKKRTQKKNKTSN